MRRAARQEIPFIPDQPLTHQSRIGRENNSFSNRVAHIATNISPAKQGLCLAFLGAAAGIFVMKGMTNTYSPEQASSSNKTMLRGGSGKSLRDKM